MVHDRTTGIKLESSCSRAKAGSVEVGIVMDRLVGIRR